MSAPPVLRRVAVLEPAPLLMVAVETAGAGGRPRVHMHAGGQGAWVARMAAELGGRPWLCAPLGGDSGAVLPVLMRREGIEVEAVPCHRPTAVWVSEGPDGDQATVAQTVTPSLDRHEVDRLYGAMLTGGMAAGVVVLTGLADPAVMPAAVFGRLARDLAANGVTVVADVSAGPLAAVLEAGGVIVKVSDEDLVAWGLATGRARHEVVRAAVVLRERGAEAVLVSRGAEPAIVHAGGRLLEISPPRLSELNRRGAGDALTGALAAGEARGMELESSLRLAVAAGALNVTRRGLGSGDRNAIERLAATLALREAA